jgi:hypothetical protein
MKKLINKLLDLLYRDMQIASSVVNKTREYLLQNCINAEFVTVEHLQTQIAIITRKHLTDAQMKRLVKLVALDLNKFGYAIKLQLGKIYIQHKNKLQYDLY